MQMGWVDYSRQERETIKELIRALGEASSIDELGVGIVRDSISDLLYPGTSVLHTRAKYYILIPELFKKAMKSGLTTGAEIRNLINTDQDKIARALRRVIDSETGVKPAGIIGGRSDKAVKMKPARVYWNALRTTKILCNPSMSFDDACITVALYNKKNQNITIKAETEEDGGDSADASEGRLAIFSAPCRQSIDEYILSPTFQLTKAEAMYLKEQFLCVPVMKNTLMEYCLKTQQVFLDNYLSEVAKQKDIPAALQHILLLAVEFSDFIYGAYIVYNLLYFENGGENATEEQIQQLNNKYAVWKTVNNGIVHKKEILALVTGHEHYKAALYDFLVKFETAVANNTSGQCSDEEKRIIKERERFCKKEKSKLGKKNYPYQEIQSAPMEFRHFTAQTVICDIMKGLVKEDG